MKNGKDQVIDQGEARSLEASTVDGTSVVIRHAFLRCHSGHCGPCQDDHGTYEQASAQDGFEVIRVKRKNQKWPKGRWCWE